MTKDRRGFEVWALGMQEADEKKEPGNSGQSKYDSG